MKTFKFELGGTFMFFHGDTMGETIKDFITARPNRINKIINIVEYHVDKVK